MAQEFEQKISFLCPNSLNHCPVFLSRVDLRVRQAMVGIKIEKDVRISIGAIELVNKSCHTSSIDGQCASDDACAYM